jgi:peptidoglycan/LPS O-acetylase OafA/YrhL
MCIGLRWFGWPRNCGSLLLDRLHRHSTTERFERRIDRTIEAILDRCQTIHMTFRPSNATPTSFDPSAVGGPVRAEKHLGVLDGWRGISILLVLCAHLLPLGPARLGLNEAAGRAGMAIFFTLSGFLITQSLIEKNDVTTFLIRRFFRIAPLAWLAIAVAFPLVDARASDYLPNLLFYANLPPQHLLPVNAHFWSLCVEAQFYAAIALVFAVFGKRGLWLIPVMCVPVMIHRISTGAVADIVTWRRVDEILAGGILAMSSTGYFGDHGRKVLQSLNAYVLLALLAASSLPALEYLNYVRPYIAAALVGTTLYRTPALLGSVLRSRVMQYLATISFALYVVHGMLSNSWLGTGDTLAKYAKRPLLFALTFLLAHFSTFYFEKRCIDFGKRLARRLKEGRDRALAN